MFRANRLRVLSLKTPYAYSPFQSFASPPCRLRPSLLPSATLTGGRAYSDDAKSPNTDDAETPATDDAKKTGTRTTRSPRKAKEKAKKARQKSKARPAPAAPAGPTAADQGHLEVVQHVFQSLDRLEDSYRTISQKLASLQEEKNGAAEEHANKKSGKDAGDEAFDKQLERQTNKLGGRLKTVERTLDILKNVLNSQEIPLVSLTKRTEDSSAPAKSKPTKKPKGEIPGPKATGKSKVSSTKVRKVASESSNSSPAESKAEEWTSLADRMRRNKKAVAAAAVAAGASGLRAARGADGKKRPPGEDSPAPRTSRTRGTPLNVESVKADSLRLTPIEIEDMPEVPRLSYGLDRALFNPGVYLLQDPHTGVYNFDPYLANIMPINEFDFNALKKYVTSSKDETLFNLARQQGKKYSGSTSSMTSMLSHFHYLLSAWRPLNFSMMSKSFNVESQRFTQILRAPAATFLHHRDGVYAIDADKEYDFATILSMLGKSMEKLLTLPRDEFERYRKKNSDQISEEERNASEAFHFSTMGDFLMRSQLDAYDPRLPGTGMFDLKTRSVISIRMDAGGYKKGLGYELRRRHGTWESFEREYFDMIRSAMLKYSLQVRMGRMDGIFVAFHNTQRIFGFQYVSINEMDNALHGTEDRALGDMEFKLSVHLLNKVMDQATNRFPGRSIRLHVETRDTNPPLMYIFAKPVTAEEIDDIQSSQAEEIAEYEKQILGLVQGQPGDQATASEAEDMESEAEQALDEVGEASMAESQRQFTWEEMQDKVEAAIEDDSLGVDHVREAIRDALEQSGLLKARTSEEARGYVDSLLEVLTRNEATEDDQQGATINVETGSLTFEVGQGGDLNVVDKASQPTEEESLTDVANKNAEATEAQLLQEAASSVESQTTDAGVSRDTSLKELILQLASTVDEKVEFDDVEQPDEEPVSDVSKLRTFGRILSELVAKSKEVGSEAEETSSPSGESSKQVEVEEQKTEQTEDSDSAPAPEEEEELLGMHLTVRNKVNGLDVVRPPRTAESWDWSLEYSLNELPSDQARRIYQAVKQRRRKVLEREDGDRDREWYKMFKGRLKQLSEEGRVYRKEKDAESQKRPVHVYGNDEPMTWDDAFGYLKDWKKDTSDQDKKE
ncbi:hypothetical protein CkaCkLH20_01319 [Colletotrichum karsti]|uniref:mRNA degradation protein n=1 Tax=Colletotrichum karsti TaxID=1095194 RepID=A0A9P6IEW5_9PEZI|nr:uncharacterized protein CkaCkLH20_01319 [Colletotrichum karsti]KAF9881169.1 hypothetical protein CkaCkLH20_01319 [Colletotrichum karsti]